MFGAEWGELTGAGHYHAGTVVGGLVGRQPLTTAGCERSGLVIDSLASDISIKEVA